MSDSNPENEVLVNEAVEEVSSPEEQVVAEESVSEESSESPENE